jgi:hypothetical protein
VFVRFYVKGLVRVCFLVCICCFCLLSECSDNLHARGLRKETWSAALNFKLTWKTTMMVAVTLIPTGGATKIMGWRSLRMQLWWRPVPHQMPSCLLWRPRPQ